ncbi:uncharacterized protein PFL1_01841 [Pseudozyma flocculosa PF-1]|uniref:uncharacterized protein n=1 Tax=Pseudozyma flocculosa PF-1 TaxID=1277687 RepID=UPI000456108F|nr:uncharacterized protein PFL1_01841 [Pseudozyma flocculosa PF-1]EPQ30943.1 hypothetical protein PFL1_01841 [Pseudozyma flocculosa PF-1]
MPHPSHHHPPPPPPPPPPPSPPHPPPSYSTTAAHRARATSHTSYRWLLYLALILALVGATRRSITSPLNTSLSSQPRSQWHDLPAEYVICSPANRPGLLSRSTHSHPPRRSIYTGHHHDGTGGGDDDDDGGNNDDPHDAYVSCLAVANHSIVALGSEHHVLHAACGLDPATPAARKRLPRSNKSARLQRQRRNLLSAPSAHTAANNCDVRRLRHGQTLYPGFQDAHGHVLDYGWSRTVVDLVGSTSKHQVVQRIEDFVRKSPELLAYALSPTSDHRPGDADADVRWIEGLGWDQTKWPDPVFPTAADLSSSPLLRKFAISLRRIDVHAIWLSQVALDLVENQAKGFPRSPADDHRIEGGLVVRDAAGRPTGVLIDNAMNLAYQVIPKWTFEQRKRYLDAAADGLLRAGITAVGDAATDLDAVDFYKKMDEQGSMPLRIYSFLACPPDERRCAHRVQQVLPATPTSRFTLRAVKLFADGALGSWGSAMWQDYSDNPGERGLLLIREQEVEPLIRYWMERGWQVGTHAIGDKANTLVLDAYQSILASSGALASADPRPRVEHAQIMRLSDTARFGRLGVIASMQPTHCTSDMGYVESRIGAERARGAYAWRTLLDANASLALGSDFPVELPDPLHGIYSAVTRLDPQGNSPHGRRGWYPGERLSRRQALRGFTLDTAYAQFEEDRAGSIRVGKRADFTILDRDILNEQTVSPAALRGAQVEATLIDGRVAYDRATDRASLLAAAISPPAYADPIRRLASQVAEDLVAELQRAWYGHSPVLLSTMVTLALVALLLLRRGGTDRDAYSNLSALALNTRRPEAEWMNMGFWRDTADFSTAARQLAEVLYSAAGVASGSRILDVGCGTGDSVLLLRERYGPKTLHAVTFLERDAARTAQRLDAAAGAEADKRSSSSSSSSSQQQQQQQQQQRQQRQHRVWCGDIAEWLVETSGSAGESYRDGDGDGDGEQKYDFILALDCAYHFQSRSDFLQLAYRRLAPGGTLGLVDLLSAWPPVRRGRASERGATFRARRCGSRRVLRPSWRGCGTRRRASCWAFRRRRCGRRTGTPRNWSERAFERRRFRSGTCPSTSFRAFRGSCEGWGRGEERAWRGGGAGTLFALRSFGGVVASWARGGDEGLVRCAVVVARKDVAVEGASAAKGVS